MILCWGLVRKLCRHADTPGSPVSENKQLQISSILSGLRLMTEFQNWTIFYGKFQMYMHCGHMPPAVYRLEGSSFFLITRKWPEQNNKVFQGPEYLVFTGADYESEEHLDI